MSFPFNGTVWTVLDSTGAPVPGAKVYTYDAGTLTAKAAYTTSALTTATSNPIIADSAGRVQFFLGSGSYRIRVFDASDVEITALAIDNISADSSVTTAQLAASSGSSLMGFIQSGTGAVARTAQAKMRDIVSVKDFGATGDGTTNDTAAITAAITAHKRVHFPNGTYFLGNWATSDRIFDMTALGDNIEFSTGSDVEFVVNCTADVNPVVFYLRSNSNFKCGPVRFRDTNYSRTSSRGLIAFTLDAFSADWGSVQIDRIYTKNCYAAFVCATKSATRVRGIKIGQIHAYQCNRGANFQDQGDNVEIGLLYAEQCERAYFAYGVTGHKVNVSTYNNYGTTGSVNIARWVGGYDTKGIEVNYVGRGATVDMCHVLIDHLDLLGGTISGVRVNVDIEGSAAYDPVRICNYTGLGGSETTSASSNFVSDITLSGSCDSNARAVDVVATFSATRLLNFTPGRFFQYSSNIPAKFSMTDSGAYSPTAAAWNADTTNPAIGNGSLTREHAIINGLCVTTYHLTIGSTSTMGTGNWKFKLPLASLVTTTGSAIIVDNGTTVYTGVVKVAAGSQDAYVYAGGSSNGLQAAVPMTWATGDTLDLTISYRVG